MKISQAIEALRKLQTENGDVLVIVRDADTEWLYDLQDKHLVVKDGRVEIAIEYTNRQFKP